MALDDSGSRGGLRHRLFLLLLFGVVPAVVVVTGLTWVTKRPPHAGRRPASPAASQPAAASKASPSPAGPVSLPSRIPGLRWANFHGVELPTSSAAGPHHQRYGLAWGFADTPAGALIAAVNIGVRANAQWGPGIFGPTIRGQVTGLGAGVLLAACHASYGQEARAAGVTGGQSLGRAYVTEQAFRWVASASSWSSAWAASCSSRPPWTSMRWLPQIVWLFAWPDACRFTVKPCRRASQVRAVQGPGIASWGAARLPRVASPPSLPRKLARAAVRLAPLALFRS